MVSYGAHFVELFELAVGAPVFSEAEQLAALRSESEARMAVRRPRTPRTGRGWHWANLRWINYTRWCPQETIGNHRKMWGLMGFIADLWVQVPIIYYDLEA